jgi:hypothetical protein
MRAKYQKNGIPVFPNLKTALCGIKNYSVLGN